MIRLKSENNFSSLRIILLGYMVRGPLGGMTWGNLQYLLGLRNLGHEIYFIEDSDCYASCYDPARNVMDTDPSYGLKYAERVLSEFGLGENWAYYDEHSAKWHGPCAGRIDEICASADLLLNRAGVNPMRPWFLQIPVRVLLDIDPGFTQIRHLKHAASMEYARQHTAFFSIAENIDSSQSSIPDDGLPWRPTRHPIFLDEWPAIKPPEKGSWTTIMQWQSYPALEYQGLTYGNKSDSFRLYLDIPQRSPHDFELVLAGGKAPRDTLTDHGWVIRDPFELSGNPWIYRRYIQQSMAEFCLAKQGYVMTRSGWFSERSAAYLATGRPVVTEETGFSDQLPTGAGLISFATPEEAIAGIEEISRDYGRHCRAARDLAVEYFDVRRILPSVLEQAMQTAE